MAAVMAYVLGSELRTEGGAVLGTFSGHWPAVATMIRLSDPTFRSLGGDRPDDLAIEAAIRLDGHARRGVMMVP